MFCVVIYQTQYQEEQNKEGLNFKPKKLLKIKNEI